MATKRNGPKKEQKYEPKRRAPSSFDERLREKADECDEAVVKEQARLWAKLERAEARLPKGDVARRSRALDRIYADLVAHSAIGSFAAGERGRQLLKANPGRDTLNWLEEQRRLEKAAFFAKIRSAGLWIFAPRHDIGILVCVGRVLGIIVWLPMFALARLVTLTLPILRMAVKRQEGH